MPNLPNTLDYLSPRIFTGIVRDSPPPGDFIGNRFFPLRPVAGDRLEWDYIYSESPLAPFVAPGAEAPRMDVDQKLTKGWAQIVYQKFKTDLRETDVRWLRTWGSAPAETPQGAMAAQARQEITRRADMLSNSIDARIEWMQLSSLLGSMVVAPTQPENVGKSLISFTLNYPIRTITASPLWSDAVNSDPYLDMRSWFNTIANSDRPWVPKVAIMSTQTFYTMALSQKISRQMFLAARATDAGLPSILTQQQLDVFFGNLGLRVILYDARYTTRAYTGAEWAITQNRYLPANKVIFLPDGAMGYTATAPAPQNNWNTGKFAWTVTPQDSGRMDPWVYELGVGFYGMPILERPDRVLVATVTA